MKLATRDGGSRAVATRASAWVFLVALSSAAPASCSPRPATFPASDPTPIRVASAKTAAVASNRFGFDIYLRARDPEDNAIVSPLSASLALAMTAAGARGATLAEMSHVLHVDTMTDAHGGFGELLSSVPDTLKVEESDGGAAEPNARAEQPGPFPRVEDIVAGAPHVPERTPPPLLHVADRIWTQAGRKYREDFLNLLRDRYRSSVGEVDFVHARGEALREINSWVERQTRRRIQNLLVPQDLNEATRLILTNALYFKGSWMHRFVREATRDEDFIAPKKTIRAPMMRQSAYFGYAKVDHLALVELPYFESSISMIVILPDGGHSLADIESRIGGEYEAWVGALAGRRVDLWLPRWKQARRFPLGGVLRALGMRQAFDPTLADFSGMTDFQPNDPGWFYIGGVIQKAFIEADEYGTEAAAATAVLVNIAISERIGPPPPEPVVFHADRPFLYVIRDRTTGAILFVGRVVDPTRES